MGVSGAEAVDALNALLRGELAAAETYRRALEHLPPTFGPRAALVFCEQSHERRAARYRELIAARGGQACRNAGVWGAFARLVTSSAEMLGPRVLIGALHEGEDHGLREYAAMAGHLDPEARRVVMEELLPEQQETHDQMGIVRASLPRPGT